MDYHQYLESIGTTCKQSLLKLLPEGIIIYIKCVKKLIYISHWFNPFDFNRKSCTF